MWSSWIFSVGWVICLKVLTSGGLALTHVLSFDNSEMVLGLETAGQLESSS